MSRPPPAAPGHRRARCRLAGFRANCPRCRRVTWWRLTFSVDRRRKAICRGPAGANDGCATEVYLSDLKEVC